MNRMQILSIVLLGFCLSGCLSICERACAQIVQSEGNAAFSGKYTTVNLDLSSLRESHAATRPMTRPATSESSEFILEAKVGSERMDAMVEGSSIKLELFETFQYVVTDLDASKAGGLFEPSGGPGPPVHTDSSIAGSIAGALKPIPALIVGGGLLSVIPDAVLAAQSDANPIISKRATVLAAYLASGPCMIDVHTDAYDFTAIFTPNDHWKELMAPKK